MTARERALKEFHKRWKKDAESDGELLPLQKRLENAWAEGRQSLAKELKEWADMEILEYLPHRAEWNRALKAVVAKCDDLMKEE